MEINAINSSVEGSRQQPHGRRWEHWSQSENEEEEEQSFGSNVTDTVSLTETGGFPAVHV